MVKPTRKLKNIAWKPYCTRLYNSAYTNIVSKPDFLKRWFMIHKKERRIFYVSSI